MGTPVRHLLTAVFCVGLLLVAPTMVGCAAGTRAGGGGGGGNENNGVDGGGNVNGNGGDGNINAGAGETRTFSGEAQCISAAGEAYCACQEDWPLVLSVTVSNGEITVGGEDGEPITVPLGADGTFTLATTLTVPCGDTQATGTLEVDAVLDESATPSTLAVEMRTEACGCVLEHEGTLTEQ